MVGPIRRRNSLSLRPMQKLRQSVGVTSRDAVNHVMCAKRLALTSDTPSSHSRIPQSSCSIRTDARETKDEETGGQSSSTGLTTEDVDRLDQVTIVRYCSAARSLL